jgi:hypothetical protein
MCSFTTQRSKGAVSNRLRRTNGFNSKSAKGPKALRQWELHRFSDLLSQVGWRAVSCQPPLFLDA